MALKSCIYTKLAIIKFQTFWLHIDRKKDCEKEKKKLRKKKTSEN